MKNKDNNNFQLTMTEEEIFDTFHYNQQYLIDNQIPEDVLRWALQRANEYLVADDEIFVQYPDYPDYFCSNYGRCISLKAKGREPKFLQPLTLTDKYTGYTFCRPKDKQLSINMSRMVADVFCPNFYEGQARGTLQAHHIDHDRTNNSWKNIALLPEKLHQAVHRCDKKHGIPDEFQICVAPVAQEKEQEGR